MSTRQQHRAENGVLAFTALPLHCAAGGFASCSLLIYHKPLLMWTGCSS
jgi:hypothetical protein